MPTGVRGPVLCGVRSSRAAPVAVLGERSSFRLALAVLTPLGLGQLGNHDASFGRFMSAAEVERYEVAFGASNRVDFVGGHLFVSLNTMALDADATSKDVKMQARRWGCSAHSEDLPTACPHSFARSFLEDLDFERLRARATGQVVLLTHLPLYREDDMQCGEERRREGGHVTYEHPTFQYEAHHHVLSRALSKELLTAIQPDVVLSGHTHAWCALRHPEGPAEFTTPAFSWGQRPDPSYSLLELSPRDASPPFSAARCALPWEPLVFGLYAVTLVLAAFSLAVKCCRGRAIGKQKRG